MGRFADNYASMELPLSMVTLEQLLGICNLGPSDGNEAAEKVFLEGGLRL